MTRFYRPDRIDYDIAQPDAGGAARWTTAGVQVVDPPESLVSGGGSLDGRALREFAGAIAPGLRDFAEQVSGAAPADVQARRYESYQAVRAVVRNAEGLLLAEVRCDGAVVIPGELDQELRRQFIGMINGWLPMTIREVDRSAYENALASLVKARRVVDAMLREVVDLAAGGLDPLPWEKVADAMSVSQDALNGWYRSPDRLNR